MKARKLLLCAVVSILAVILLAGCGQGKYAPKPNEELYGTWTNDSYSGKISPDTYLPQKEVIDSSGYSAYRFISDANRYWRGSEIIDSKWMDSEGNVWYKAYSSHATDQAAIIFQSLCKLSKSSTVRESVYLVCPKYTPGSYPAKIDPQDRSYTIYHRAEK